MRSLISIPAGIAGMGTSTFLLWTSLGACAWSSALAIVGFTLGNRYEEVARFVGLFSNITIAAALMLYVYRVATFRR